MGYSKAETEKKQEKLVSKTQRNSRKILVIFFKIILVGIIAVIIAGAGAGFGMMKGILDNAPDVSNISIVPKGFRSNIYDKDGKVEKEISQAVIRRMPRYYRYLGELLAYNSMHESELNFWNLVCDGLEAARYVHSARLLRHSLQPRPDDLLFNNCSSLAMKIKRDSEFQKKMAEIIEEQKFGVETSVIFNSDFKASKAAIEVVTIEG